MPKVDAFECLNAELHEPQLVEALDLKCTLLLLKSYERNCKNCGTPESPAAEWGPEMTYREGRSLGTSWERTPKPLTPWERAPRDRPRPSGVNDVSVPRLRSEALAELCGAQRRPLGCPGVVGKREDRQIDRHTVHAYIP